ncbi:MAG: AraC family transcriptional regulator [Clostridiales bacterium]|nr:AraC family transcriptional regulator [Clostridiales bacterium]
MLMPGSSNDRINDIAFSLKDIMVYSNKPGHSIKIDLNEHFRIVYISRGSAEFVFSDRSIQSRAGDILYIPSETQYTSKWDTENPSTFFMLDLKLLDHKDTGLNFGVKPRILFHDDIHFYDEFIEDIEHLTYDIPYGWLNRMSLALKLLYYISADSSNEKYSKSYWKIRNGIRYIEEKFSSDFLVSDIAELCLMSEGNFRRLFNSVKGMSPIAYRNRLRIQKSTELLKSGLYNVSEAGEAVGIDDIKHFSKLFKQITGSNPSQILKK